MIKKILSVLTVLICLWGCKADKITIPAYIQINDYTVKTNCPSQGTTDQKFTDMLVFANGQSCGTFPVGKPIPVISNGATTFLIRGVVEINGVSAVRADYELMAGCDTVIAVTPGKVTTIKPVFKYFTDDVFRWLEDFDGNNCASASSGGSSLTNADTTSHIVSPGFNSNHCLVMRPNATIQTSYVNKTSVISLPASGVGVYMELNYKSNVSLNVVIKGAASGNSYGAGGVYPSVGWNKVYLDLTEEVSNLNESNGLYYLTFYASYVPGIGTNYVYVDDIKVISKQ